MNRTSNTGVHHQPTIARDPRQRMEEQLDAAFRAVADGTADERQQALHAACCVTVSRNINNEGLIEHIAAAVGEFATINETPWADLGPAGRWIRQASAKADRSGPALSDMGAVFSLLVSTEQNSGAVLKLGEGVNIIGLDRNNRRWLIPEVSKEAVRAARTAEDDRKAQRAIRASGSISTHWSIERTRLVPDPDRVDALLPLPDGGKYLVVYQGPRTIVAKTAFVTAFRQLAERFPICDLLIWDTDGDSATLWSCRGLVGHSNGDDTTWGDMESYAVDLAENLRSH